MTERATEGEGVLVVPDSFFRHNTDKSYEPDGNHHTASETAAVKSVCKREGRGDKERESKCVCVVLWSHKQQ